MATLRYYKIINSNILQTLTKHSKYYSKLLPSEINESISAPLLKE